MADRSVLVPMTLSDLERKDEKGQAFLGGALEAHKAQTGCGLRSASISSYACLSMSTQSRSSLPTRGVQKVLQLGMIM